MKRFKNKKMISLIIVMTIHALSITNRNDKDK